MKMVGTIEIIKAIVEGKIAVKHMPWRTETDYNFRIAFFMCKSGEVMNITQEIAEMAGIVKLGQTKQNGRDIRVAGILINAENLKSATEFILQSIIDKHTDFGKLQIKFKKL